MAFGLRLKTLFCARSRQSKMDAQTYSFNFPWFRPILSDGVFVENRNFIGNDLPLAGKLNVYAAER